MSTEGINVDDEAISSCSAANSNPSSPRNRVKFLCSHGGKILPRPGDGHLKYVGGETRVISVPRDITFPDLMKKLTCLIDGEMVLKYQLMPEELDALVSVKSDEDVRHMFAECERHHGSARLRAFLFPAAAPVVLENVAGGTMEEAHMHALEQRYIDAINGIIRITPTINVTQKQGCTACSSPRSPPESYNINAETMNNNIETTTTMVWGGNNNNYHNPRSCHLHKVRSTPNICSLNFQQNSTTTHSPTNYYHHMMSYRPCSYQHTIPPVVVVDPSRGSTVAERLISVRSTGRLRHHRPDHYHCSSTSSQNRGAGSWPWSWSCNKCVHFEEYDRCSERRMIDRSVFSTAEYCNESSSYLEPPACMEPAE